MTVEYVTQFTRWMPLDSLARVPARALPRSEAEMNSVERDMLLILRCLELQGTVGFGLK